MTHDELEFLISQHFDGTLSADEAEKLRVAVASDLSAKALFDEHAKLDAALKSSRATLDIDAEWLGAQIAGTIDDAQSRPIRISNWNLFAPMAAAAVLLIALTLGVFLVKDNDVTSPGQTIAQVSLPDVPERPRDAVASVSVGVPANLTPAMMTTLFLADHRPPNRVVIQPAGQRRGDPFD